MNETGAQRPAQRPAQRAAQRPVPTPPPLPARRGSKKKLNVNVVEDKHAICVSINDGARGETDMVLMINKFSGMKIKKKG